MDNALKEMFEKEKSLSAISRLLFGKANYTNNEKVKKILSSNGIDWKDWLESKKIKIKCKNCGKEFIAKYKGRKFCCHSCSATYNNKLRGKREARCLNCGKNIYYRNKFCNNTCYAEYEQKEYIKRWKEGIYDGINGKYQIIGAVKKYIFEKNEYKCEKCGNSYTNPYTNNSILQIHHIDGDCTNNKEENLQLLCPNCHAMTENYGSRNKKATRKDNRKRY